METNRVNQHLIGLSYNEIIPKLEFIDDPGDCCGWSSLDEIGSIPDDVSVDDLVLKDCVSIDYASGATQCRSVLNFVFTTKEGDEVVLGYELSAGSGSGWSYGAFIEIKHDGQTLAEERW